MKRKICLEIPSSLFRMKPRIRYLVIIFAIFVFISISIITRRNHFEDSHITLEDITVDDTTLGGSIEGTILKKPKYLECMNRNLCEFIEVMNGRKLRVLEVCNTNSFGHRYSNNGVAHYYLLRNMGIVWCPVYKAAASTWINHLITAVNQTHGHVKSREKSSTTRYSPLDLLRIHGAIRPSRTVWSKYVEELSMLNSNLTGFLVVRHPFERLVSAYRDKLERNNIIEPYYYNTFGKHFVKKYREKAKTALGEEYFTETNNFGTPLKVKDNRRPNADLPTFWEFAQSVIDGYKMDEHWEPIYKYCSICNPSSLKAFEYVLKFENLLSEEKKFLEYHRWNISEKDILKLNINRPDTISDDQLTKLYFSSLSQDQIIGLYKVYELDFLLFDYTFQFNDLKLPMTK